MTTLIFYPVYSLGGDTVLTGDCMLSVESRKRFLSFIQRPALRSRTAMKSKAGKAPLNQSNVLSITITEAANVLG